MELASLVARVTEGHDLSVSDAEAAFDRVMSGAASPVQIAALLVALKTKGHAASEVAGGVRALRRAMVSVPVADPEPLVDTCGTGGGTITTFNISTAAALVVAGAGVPVAKHGNRSFTSRSGSADVLEALGVTIQLSPRSMGRVLERAGIVFMFAPLLHPAMRFVAPVRKELGISTIMNVLGPLTNPAGARRQVLGVADSHLLPLLGEALRALEHQRAMIVHGSAGLDEISPSGVTRVAELEGGELREYEVRPGDFGLPEAPIADLAGGGPDENARLIEDLLAGRREDGALTATLMNAAAALYVAGRVAGLQEGAERAREAVASGAAQRALAALREASEAEARSDDA